MIVLCKIAAKEVEGPGGMDVYMAHSKVLAMDLIRQLLEGPAASAWLAALHIPLRQSLGVALLRGAGGGDQSSGGGGGGGRAGTSAAALKAASPLPGMACQILLATSWV